MPLLGPLLYVLYTAELARWLHGTVYAATSVYADDIQLVYISVTVSNIAAAVQSLIAA